ncbi:MAG TPA: right-handed parallel beta-helix repeat-containing protein, partial [Candidatus Acidoferrales bacterium]|nr:right-handed parallel beta-helix repeat-containing protein [Candidatus Acidoferrales bacterium]
SPQAATFEVSQRDPKATDDGPGTPEQPWKTLAKAIQQAAPGDLVFIRDGVYREHLVFKASGTALNPIRFQAAPGAQVVLTGADLLTGWRKRDGPQKVYTIAWPYRFIPWSKNMSHPDDEYHQLIGRCEQVAVDGYLLRQVLDAGQLAPGSFWVDVTNRLLSVWDAGNRDLNHVRVEGSTRSEICEVAGNYLELAGLHFRFAANMAQHGAVVLSGTHDVLQDCVMEDMNASGATFVGEDLVVKRCTFRDNGQLGFGANGAHRLLFTGCLVENNNTKGFDRGWEAGGDKLVLCRDAVLEESRFLRNRGNGLWFDIGNEHCTVRNCLIADNEDGGLFDEISFGLQAHDNVITGNGFAETPGAWGAQAGITLSSSPESVIERNLIVGNREGFDFREQTRTTPRIGDPKEVPVWNHDELIRGNLIAFNRDAQVWGWFDMADNRHWPAPNAGADSTSASRNGQHHLVLSDLRLRFADNVYGAGTGRPLFEWGPGWARHKSYPTLADFRSDLGIDDGGRMMDPGFANVAARDFRVPRNLMSELHGAYPQGSVPDCSLGWLR